MFNFKDKFTYDSVEASGLIVTFHHVTLLVALGSAPAGAVYATGIWDIMADTLTLIVEPGTTVPVTVSLG